jgi:hypothetical protein
MVAWESSGYKEELGDYGRSMNHEGLEDEMDSEMQQ